MNHGLSQLERQRIYHPGSVQLATTVSPREEGHQIHTHSQTKEQNNATSLNSDSFGVSCLILELSAVEISAFSLI